MKDFIKILVIFALLVTIIPSLAFLKGEDEAYAEDSPQSELTETEKISEEISETSITSATAYSHYEILEEILKSDDDKYKVLDFTTGQVLEITLKDYIIGAVLAEMPATFHEEALKAQAVASATYALRRKEEQLIAPDAELLGAYISNDSSKYQAYFTPETAKNFYGDGYDEYYDKVSAAVSAVSGKILVYQGEPIIAAFHSTSGGMTESAEIIWGAPVDYLIPVESELDKSSPTFLEEKTFTAAELKARLEAEYPGIFFEGDKSGWLRIEETSQSGTAISVTAGNMTLKGTELRMVLSLRSANLTIGYDVTEDIFRIITKGYGHGVGLSQYGANAMATEGATYDEILLHYYPGAELISE